MILKYTKRTEAKQRCLIYAEGNVTLDTLPLCADQILSRLL